MCGAGYLYLTTLGRDHRLAPQRRRAVHDANIGPYGRGVVPGGSKELKLRMVDEGPEGGGEELVHANVARRRHPAHAGREPQRRRAVHGAAVGVGFS